MITVFQNGDQGSRRIMMNALNSVRDEGSQILTSLNTAYMQTLVDLERRLSALNARRQRMNRLSSLRTLGVFTMGDFNDIDQAASTATVRIDAQCATLRERSEPCEAAVKSNVFSTDIGTTENMGDLKRVHVDGVGSPTGTFNIELVEPLSVTLLVFDIVATPSVPVVTVQVSSNGVQYSDALASSISGYRVSTWLPQQSVRFIRITISPSHPDDLGGNAYTFGITDIDASSVQFQLLSEVVSRTILINPVSPSFQFVADADPGVIFFLSVAGQPYIEVANGDVIQIPPVVGVQNVTASAVALDGTGKLGTTIPSNIYLSTLTVVDSTSKTPYPIVSGLSITAPGVAQLASKYVSILNTALYLVNFVSATDAGKTFDVAYTSGPSPISIQVRAQITTADRSVTPALRGVSFQEV
jgi:hypothetical protein